MASIYIKQGKIWISLYQDGKRIRKSTGLLDTKANRKMVERELLPNIDFSIKKGVGYYYKVMMAQKEMKPATIKRYDGIYNKHISCFRDRAIDSFKVSELKTWVSDISVSAKTTHLHVTVFRQIFQEAIFDEAITKNPFDAIRLPKAKSKEPKPFTTDEVSLLLEMADGWFKNLLAVLFLTGMRIGEALALEWSDIDDFICINKTLGDGIVGLTKTENTRYIPVFDALRPYLQRQRLLTGLANKRVFVGLNGAKDLFKIWHRLLSKCDLEHRVLYQARHTFAIHALDSGMFKVSQIAQILGHASVQMLFQKYAKFIRSEVDKIPTNFSTLGTNLGTKVV